MKNRVFVHEDVFTSETQLIARDVIESNEISPQDKLDVAEQIRRVANVIEAAI